MPRLSASLFYKDFDFLEPMPFDKLFNFEKFNVLCNGFVRLGCYSDLLNKSKLFEVLKGSGRSWTKERDLDQLTQCRKESVDGTEVIWMLGENPFLWIDHSPVKDYAKIFECLVAVDEIEKGIAKTTSKIRDVGRQVRKNSNASQKKESSDSLQDWMIHCKKVEQSLSINQICSIKEEIMERVSHIDTPVYISL